MEIAEELKVAELEKIRKRNHGGLLLAEAVVESARDPKSPLHEDFEWSDGEAAKLYRLDQARCLIRVFITDDGQSRPTPTYVSLGRDRQTGGGYRRFDGVLRNRKLTAALELDCRRELRAWHARWSRMLPNDAVVITVSSVAGFDAEREAAGC